MDDIIGALLYNGFLKLPGSNQTFEENQGLFSLPRPRQAGRKKCYIMRSQRGLEKV